MAEDQRLGRYGEKRDFRKSPEPSGRGRGSAGAGQPQFVIQLHDARSRHFDFRLEADGVLRSWAVPKGPSTDPKEKRLATPTEDHPLDYQDFEGVIPGGEYGAGAVVVWDTGPYRNLTASRDGEEVPVAEAVDRGHVKFWLEGHKLTGGYALTRLQGREDWLLVKLRDDKADARRNPVSTQPESVRTGRTVEQVAAEEGEPGETR